MPEGRRTRAQEKRLERLHILATLREHGPMLGVDVVRHANGECVHEAFEAVPDLANRGIGSKLSGLWDAGFVHAEHGGWREPATYAITNSGREFLRKGLAALGEERSA